MSVAKVRAAMSIFIVRLHVTDPRRSNCASAGANRPALAAVRRLRNAHFSRNHAPEIAALFIAPTRSLRFAVLSHTGPIGIVPVGVVEVAAVLKGGRARRADVAAGSLGVAWRCQRGHGEPQGKHSQTFPQDSHDESPSIYWWWDHATLLMNSDALATRLQAHGFVRSAPASRKGDPTRHGRGPSVATAPSIVAPIRRSVARPRGPSRPVRRVRSGQGRDQADRHPQRAS